jgi:hypothetical protein
MPDIVVFYCTSEIKNCKMKIILPGTHLATKKPTSAPAHFWRYAMSFAVAWSSASTKITGGLAVFVK